MTRYALGRLIGYAIVGLAAVCRGVWFVMRAVMLIAIGVAVAVLFNWWR